ncbi:MAG: group I truncated hemoglobin [Ferrovibrionaceae bacterium]
MRKLHLPLVLALGLGLAACAEMAADPTVPPPSLYARIGGMPTINAVVDDFIANVAADPVINRRFARTNIPKLKASLADQICAASGGPCTYRGGTMLEVHKGMDITDTEFNAMAGDMDKTLRKFGVPKKEYDELMAILASTRGDIVGR